MREKTIEEYCRAIGKLEKGAGVRSKDLCLALSLSKNTVASTLRKLSDGGYVRMEPYGRVSLARPGTLIARRMNFRHRVLETFLAKKLGMDLRTVHTEADALEHAASDRMILRLYEFLGRPRKDPHGREI